MTFIYFVFVLGVTIMIHEFGHFIFAKKAGVHVYEFSLGMGPQLFKFHRKNDETIYSIRLFPIGGYVSMAGEDLEDDAQNVPADRQMCNKKWYQRFSIIVAGVVFNFLLAIVLLFVVAIGSGVPATTPYIEVTNDLNYPITTTNMQTNDKIIAVNGKRVNSVDRLILELQISNGKAIDFQVKHKDGKIETITVAPIVNETEAGKSYQYGISILPEKNQSVGSAMRYAFVKTGNLVEQMTMIIGYLITGDLSLDNLSGPIGIFTIVGESAKAGFLNILYLIAYLCINVGLINIIPLPAFDGGRLLFLIIEKIKGSKVSPKIENTIHSVGFILLMVLMVFVTYNDILRLFK